MNHERIAILLASGLKAAQVSTIVGISPSRISQLLQEEDFKNLLMLKEADNNEKDIEETAITAKYHAAEHLLLDQITALAPISELRDVVGALKVVADRQDKAKTRTNPNPVGGTVIHQNIVNLQLPAQALPPKTIHMAGSREVVGIGDLELSPMGSQGVTNLFTSLRSEAERHIPLSTSPTSPTSPTKIDSTSIENLRDIEGDNNHEPITIDTTRTLRSSEESYQENLFPYP